MVRKEMNRWWHTLVTILALQQVINNARQGARLA